MADPASFLADPVSFTPDMPVPKSFVPDDGLNVAPSEQPLKPRGLFQGMVDVANLGVQKAGEGITDVMNTWLGGTPEKPIVQYGKPIVTLANPLTPDEEAQISPSLAGIYRSVGRAANSLTTPEMIGTLPFLAAKPVLGGMAALTAANVPGQVRDARAVISNPTATPADKFEAGTEPVIGTVMAALMGMGARKGAVAPVDMAKPTIPIDVAKVNEGLQPQPPVAPPATPVLSPQPETVPPITPQSFTPDETLQAKPQIPSPTPGQATTDIQIPQSDEAVRPVQPEGEQPQSGQEGQGLAPEATPEPPTAPFQPSAALTPAEQANEQRLLAEAHAEPGGTTGIAHRIREQVAATGRVEPPVRGEGISTADSVARGDSLLAADPTAADRHMAAFENDPHKAISAEGMAIARAKMRQLDQAAKRAEEKGIGTPEYEAAFRAASDWQARTKKMQTEWHRSGMAQQGEQDIDTGSVTSMRQAYIDATGKDFTPGQIKTVKEVTTRVKAVSDAAETAKGKLNETLKRTAKDSPVWAKVKEYLEKGEDGFDDIRHKVATDLGMRVEDVTKELTANKQTKRLADDVWRKQEALRRFQYQAKRWLKGAAIPEWEKALATLPQAAFAAKVGFHGLVAEGTHAPMLAFQPRFYANYFRDFGKMYKLVGWPHKQANARAYYEMQVQDLLRRPNYIKARRAGLQNDPSNFEEYASIDLQGKVNKGLEKIDPKVADYFNSIAGMGNRGYSILKILRQDLFDQRWNALPESKQTPEFAKEIATIVNHVTGVTEAGASGASKWPNLVLFAPRLLGSRYMWLAGDPIRAGKIMVNTLINWKSTTPAEKYFAIEQVKEKAWVVGTLLALLKANQGMLSATDSDQKINFTDPMKGDFLNFKAAGMRASYGSAMVNMAKLPVKLYAIRASDGGKLKNLIYPDEDSAKVIEQFVRSQASPIANIAADLWFKADSQNRPLPISERPVPKRLQAQGIGPYTWPEWATEAALPIPAEEAAREVWKHMGMNEEQIKDARRTMAAISIFGQAGTGGRIAEDTQSVSPMDKQRQQVAQKMFPGKDVTADLKARADVEEAIKKEQPKAMEHKYADALPENVRKYLKNEKVAVPTTVEEVTINRQRVPLNDAEQAYYDKLIVDRYTKYFNAVTQQVDFRNSSRYDKQRQVDFETAGLRKDAREQLKAAIQDKKVPPL